MTVALQHDALSSNLGMDRARLVFEESSKHELLRVGLVLAGTAIPLITQGLGVGTRVHRKDLRK